MFQPFEILNEVYLQRLIELKRFYLVSQTYVRGDAEGKISLMITDYDDPGLAAGHHRAVSDDGYGVRINLNNARHLAKIRQMMEAGSKYRLHWCVVRDKTLIEKRINYRMRDNMRRWIDLNTKWRIGREESIRPKVEVIFGELFVGFKRGREYIRIKFDELEAA